MSVSLVTRGKASVLTSAPLRRTLKRQFERALRAAGLPDAQVCLSLSDDEELLHLNQTYADEDHATDVLSFSQSSDIPLPLAERMLGDIVISVETAQKQAESSAHPLLYELLHLSVHGLCHLLGYDHAIKEEEVRMFGYEAKLREQAFGKGRIKLVFDSAKVA